MALVNQIGSLLQYQQIVMVSYIGHLDNNPLYKYKMGLTRTCKWDDLWPGLINLVYSGSQCRVLI